MALKTSSIHLITMSDLFINISAGFFGLVLITPFLEVSPFVFTKNLFFGAFFYYVSVKLKEVI